MSLLPSLRPPSTLLSLSHKYLHFSPKSHSLPFSSRAFSVRSSSSENPAFVDEWGDKSEPEPEPASRFSAPDPPKDDDEWGGSGVELGNGSPVVEDGGGRLWELKRALVDTVYGSDSGFRASAEVRAEALELVSQLEAANPTPAPTECPDLLDGNWILVYTAFSELLPLLAVGSIPFVKVEEISQSIDTSSLTIENSTTLSSPISTLSFSAIASFEVRSPSRIQVEFKEGKFKPPEIKSSIDLPENVNIFGQNINLSPVQQSLNPLQNGIEGIARAISGQPPLKVRIPGEQTKSWLLITYLDKDFRISRGDGGLFVLVKKGSPLLD
ncbi:plastoglobulin-1, chloroplastic [Salvia miltiorrhiza]|uniref:plastoglobulin-1, chloroplastic n=1 Tax=Salvia miltiorrhiza TaxID=226208 RepID=UPI0025ACEB47|nr:plastoglobulin-1, chloroplastic [Salvia miltiorrhiza]